ncbi:MAG: hypothetical protein ABIS69_03865 [Sediminibacterium sp.]
MDQLRAAALKRTYAGRFHMMTELLKMDSMFLYKNYPQAIVSGK